jgi:CheY-like chemotaxis protein
MRVLLVEDDENKILQLTQFLTESLPRVQISTSRSLRSGIYQLRTSSPELILLDMTLPNYDIGPNEPGGQMHPLGGREFLRQMDRFDIVVPVVVVTQFERFGKGPQAMDIKDLDLVLRRDHGRIYRGIVYYHAAIHGWQGELLQLIRDIG